MNFSALFLLLSLTRAYHFPYDLGDPFKYAFVSKLDNPSNMQRLLFSPERQLLIAYSPSQPSPLIYSLHSLLPLPLFPPFLSFRSPTSINFFNQTNIIYGNSLGQIWIRYRVDSDFKEVLMYKIEDSENTVVKKVVVSEGGQYWAAYCTDGYVVYYGNVTDPPIDPANAYFSSDTVIYDLEWMPNSTNFIVTGGSVQLAQYYTHRFYADQKASDPLYINDGQVLSLALPTPYLLLYLEATDPSTFYLQSYNFETEKKESHLLEDMKPMEMRVRGKFISIKDRDQTEWLFQKDFQGKDDRIFALTNQLIKGSGYSLDGAYLFVGEPNKLYLYGICQGYESSYYNYGDNTCSSCESPCLSCYLWANSCSSCINESYRIDHRSHKCPECIEVLPHCLTCNQSECITCEEQFYVVEGGCVGCYAVVEHCKKCISVNECGECVDDGYLLVEGQCLYCSELMEHCLRCQSGTVCKQCVQNYVLVEQFCLGCGQLMEGCQNCTNDRQCNTCIDQYFLAEKQCHKCSASLPGCLLCQSDQICQKCAEKYAINKNSTCSLCSKLIEGCELCGSSEECQQCQQEYQLVDHKCQSCGALIEGCRLCSSPDACTECENAYLLVEHTCKLCSAFIQNCINCVSKGQCRECDKQFLLVENTCKSCQQCIEGCLSCKSAQQCLRCDSPYQLSNGTCKTCQILMEGCLNCSSAQICTQCSENYNLNAETHRCDSTQGWSTFMVILTIISGLVLVGAIAVVVWKVKVRRRKNQYQEELLSGSEVEQGQPYPQGGYLIPE